MRKLFLLLSLLAAPLAAQTNPCAGLSLGFNGNFNGFHPFPGAPYTTTITNAPLDPSNAAWQAEMGGYGLHPDGGGDPVGYYGIPYNVVDSSVTPLVHMENLLYVDPDSDKMKMPLTSAIVVEGRMPACPFDPVAGDGGDHHLLVVDKNKCVVYESWVGSLCSGRAHPWESNNSAVWDLTTNQRRPWGITSVDASGLSVFAGIVKYEEATTQTVPATLPDGTVVQTLGHAIRFTTLFWKQGGTPYGSYYAFPATHGAGGCCSGTTNVAGMRIRLKASFDTSSQTGYNLVLLNTMKSYGLVNSDRGANLFFQLAYDPRWNDDTLNYFKTITGSNFEVIQMGTLYTDATVPTGTPPTITGTPTLSKSVIVQGETVQIAPAPATGASYQFFTEGPFFRTGDTSVADTPLSTTCYTQTARNAFGTAVSPPACVTVLVPPLKGVDVRGLR